MIDWSDAEPDFVRPKNVVEIRTLVDAMKLLDEWQAAYQDLERDYNRMHSDYIGMKLRLETTQALREIDEFERQYTASSAVDGRVTVR